MGREYGVEFLSSDFKKRNGYKRSTELSREHALYRQNYCGCVFSEEGVGGALSGETRIRPRPSLSG